MRKILGIFISVGVATCLTTSAALSDRRSLRAQYEHLMAIRSTGGIMLDCGSVTVPTAEWNAVTGIVETVWNDYTNRLEKARAMREDRIRRAKEAASSAAESRRKRGLERVRDIRRAAEEARKGGAK